MGKISHGPSLRCDERCSAIVDVEIGASCVANRAKSGRLRESLIAGMAIVGDRLGGDPDAE